MAVSIVRKANGLCYNAAGRRVACPRATTVKSTKVGKPLWQNIPTGIQMDESPMYEGSDMMPMQDLIAPATSPYWQNQTIAPSTVQNVAYGYGQSYNYGASQPVFDSAAYDIMTQEYGGSGYGDEGLFGLGAAAVYLDEGQAQNAALTACTECSAFNIANKAAVSSAIGALYKNGLMVYQGDVSNIAIAEKLPSVLATMQKELAARNSSAFYPVLATALTNMYNSGYMIARPLPYASGGAVSAPVKSSAPGTPWTAQASSVIETLKKGFTDIYGTATGKQVAASSVAPRGGGGGANWGSIALVVGGIAAVGAAAWYMTRKK